MAFLASNAITSDAYIRIKRTANQLKLNLESFNIQLQSENTDYDFLRSIYLTMQRANNQFDELQATPGLAAYAKDQEDNQDYDIVGEFGAMLQTIDVAVAWMVANVPLDVNAVPVDQWDEGTMISNTFTPAQTVGLQSALANIIAGIA